MDLYRAPQSGAQAGAGGLEVLGAAGAGGGPHHVGQAGKDPIQVDGVGLGQAVGQSVQAQVGAGHRLGGVVEIGPGAHHGGVHAAGLIAALHGAQGRQEVCMAVLGLIAENRAGVPHVKGVAVVGYGRQTETPGTASRHGEHPTGPGG